MTSEDQGYPKAARLEGDLPLLRVPVKLSWSDLQRISPAALAYLGDAVFELFVRTHCLLPPRRLRSYHQQVVSQVRAEAQAHYLQLLIPHLTVAEQEILRQGRNAAAGGPKRVAPEIYQQATSLETLLGYLYLTDAHRLEQLLQHLATEILGPV